MALRKRVEVLFEPEKFSYLEQLARREHTSVGKLIREAVTKVYLEAAIDKRRKAARWLTEQEIDFGADWEQIKAYLEEKRTKQVMGTVDQDILQ